MKKVGAQSTGKSGSAGLTGKNKPKVGNTLPSGGKLPTVSPVTSKNYASSSYKTPKANKSTFGIIWFPTKKRNKHKELVYNSHQNEQTGGRAPSMYNFMSGDSSNQQMFLKKKEEESDHIAPERSGYIPVAVAGTGAVTASEIPPDINANSDEKIETIHRNKEDSKIAAGDTNDNDKSDRDYLENDEKDKKSPDTKTEKEKVCDNVDSVFLRSRPPHKTQSTASTVEEEDCGVKCLYYTLECCDCVVM